MFEHSQKLWWHWIRIQNSKHSKCRIVRVCESNPIFSSLLYIHLRLDRIICRNVYFRHRITALARVLLLSEQMQSPVSSTRLRNIPGK